MALLPSIKTDTGTGGTVSPATTSPTTATSPYVSSTVLRSGTKSDEVKLLQQKLASSGYYTGSIDGSYGPMTLAAVKAYQQKTGLAIDGVAGPQTLGSLGLVSGATPQGTATPIVAPVQKPQAAKQQGVTDTATGGVVSQIAPVVPKEPIVKPQAGKQQGYTDTATGQTAPMQNAYLGNAPALPTQQPAPAPTTTPTQQQAQTQTQQPVQQTPVGDNVVLPTTTPTTAPQGTTTPAGTQIGPRPTTPPTGTPTGATGAKPGAGGGTTTPGLFQPTPYQPQPNQFLEALTQMQFAYDPFQDDEYLRRAKDFELQVTDMMVGRGGLYSSVGAEALKSSLIQLQADMTEQKYQQFLQDRNFTLQMASFVADENERAFSNYMKQQEFAFAQDKEAWDRQTWSAEFDFAKDKEAWDRQTWSAEFDFAKEKEAFDRYTWQEEMNYKQAQAQFDQQMQIARYNLSVQSQRAQEQLARYEMEKAAEAAKYESLIKLAEQDLKGAQAFVAKTNIDYEKDEKAYYNYLKQAKADGYADKYTAKYFGVSTGTPISSQSLISAIMNKASYLDSWKAELGYVAESLAMDADALLNIDDFATRNAKLGRMTK